MMGIELIQGDITQLKVDAIVNAANNAMCGGGGVDGAIHRAAGPELLALCRTLGGCQTGQAKITPGFNLPAKYIIHTVGPVWYGGGNHEAAMLTSCYQQSLQLAHEHRLRHIAFPAISCGSYRYPIAQAAHIAIQTTQAWLQQNDRDLQVLLINFEDKTHQQFVAVFKELYG
ncbi:O-acetyl-ADP-ribose deacetylase [Marinicella meishanensis]|uniref:O-acetyl-ADP-ribose deacetylase n=1 Tax=Marinicella meishanensis TaxID=2873263 RepID=UPI002105F94B|nr:O-acetyl-ADP-ribose deacetylase [Marinicella sp. NBU2979]